MTSPWWNNNSGSTEGIFNGTFLPQNVSAYFKRPAKITKSSSRNQSPRTGSVRRSMTTHLPARARSVVEHQRSSTNVHQRPIRNINPARPISWHPNFAQELQQYQLPNQQYVYQAPDQQPNTTFAYGQATPYSYPAADAPYLECPNVALDQMSGSDFNFYSNTQQIPYTYPTGYDVGSYNHTPMSFVPSEANDLELSTMAWPQLPSSAPYAVATAPTSPDFLPMPDLGQSFNADELDEAVDKEELVGMGLYDSPAQVQSSSLLFSGSMPVRRKSLKLEEAFEPAPQPEAEDDDAESEPTTEEEDLAVSEAYHQPQMVLNPHHDPSIVVQYYNNDYAYGAMPQRMPTASYGSNYPTEQMSANGAACNFF